ncbi:12574_t:CDS:2 [Funneliformis mosseae]|uniref:12574_t:CDS:1 n=1 Tax=Funneliformis mosseae TaxID=27381 RepID=A0A9N9BV50_FUNMO|nr:12574_t:CDS:2 [Funneliformis mosseae]
MVLPIRFYDRFTVETREFCQATIPSFEFTEEVNVKQVRFLVKIEVLIIAEPVATRDCYAHKRIFTDLFVVIEIDLTEWMDDLIKYMLWHEH